MKLWPWLGQPFLNTNLSFVRHWDGLWLEKRGTGVLVVRLPKLNFKAIIVNRTCDTGVTWIGVGFTWNKNAHRSIGTRHQNNNDKNYYKLQYNLYGLFYLDMDTLTLNTACKNENLQMNQMKQRYIQKGDNIYRFKMYTSPEMTSFNVKSKLYSCLSSYTFRISISKK